jgi:hypothetical protein
LLPEHETVLAVNDALNQWKELSVFAGDQRVVINRKYSSFVDNEGGDPVEPDSDVQTSRRRSQRS